MSDQPSQAAVAAPIVLDLGKQRKKRLKELKQSRGPLVEEVTQAIAHVNGQLGVDGAGKVLVPVIVIYKEKRRRQPFGF
jgi:hypothetical protein